MSFIVAVKHPRWDGQDTWAFVECNNKAEVYQLRLMVKRISNRFRVTRVADVLPYDEAMYQLEMNEIARHPQVLYALSERTEVPT